MKKQATIAAIAFVCAMRAVAQAAVTPHALFADHAVLQRDVELPVWGTASAGERVVVALNGHTATATADASGYWKAVLPPQPAGGPYLLTVAGETNIVDVDDILLGDVWLASGQSNMEFRLSGRQRVANDPLPAEADRLPKIRLFEVARATEFKPAATTAGRWAVCSHETVNDFSGVAYYFARDVHASTGVPVGLIVSAWGGTLAEAWTSAGALAALDDFRQPVADLRAKATAEREGPPRAERLATWYAANDPGSKPGASWADPSAPTKGWTPRRLPAMWPGPDFLGVVWYRRTIDLPADAAGKPATLMLGRIDDTDTVWINGVEVGASESWLVDRRYAVPAGVLKAGPNVVALRVTNTDGPGGLLGPADAMKLDTATAAGPVALAGEWLTRRGGTVNDNYPAPGSSPNVPTVLYNGMIAPLLPCPIKGVIWYQGESNQFRAKQYETLFPALIADWRRAWGRPTLPFLYVQVAPFKGMSPEIREAQRRVLAATTNTAMVVTTQCGDAEDIHPKNKEPVGVGLALAARALAYGESVEYAGPLLRSMHVDGRRAVVEFSHIGGGLMAGGDALRGFTVAGDDGRFVPATARIEGDTVVVQADSVAVPKVVRYGWATVPDVNLFNRAGLPASPFRTDESH